MAVGEWDERQLCPDGSCVGVIGDNGHCKVCNRVATNWGNERDRGLQAKSPADAPVVADDELGPDEEWDDDDEGADDAEDAGDEDAEKLAELDPSTPSLIGAPAEWTKRILCTDGACIGVIGADGRCKVCGKPAKGKGLASATRAGADIDHDSGSLESRHDDTTDGDDGAASSDDDDDDDDEGEDEDDEDGDDEDDDDDDEEESSDDDKRSAAAAGERAEASVAATATGVDAELLAAANDMAATLPTEADFDRKLCPDGACVGVMGDNGRCGICGKEAA